MTGHDAARFGVLALAGELLVEDRVEQLGSLLAENGFVFAVATLATSTPPLVDTLYDRPGRTPDERAGRIPAIYLSYTEYSPILVIVLVRHPRGQTPSVQAYLNEVKGNSAPTESCDQPLRALSP